MQLLVWQLLLLPVAVAPRLCVDIIELLNRDAMLVTTAAECVDEGEIKPLLSLGCKNLDSLLGGGLRAAEVVEVAGSAGIGKTQVCLAAAAAALCTDSRASVTIITSSSSHIEMRLQELVEERIASSVTTWWTGQQSGVPTEPLALRLSRHATVLRQGRSGTAMSDRDVEEHLAVNLAASIRAEADCALRCVRVIQVFDASALLALILALEAAWRGSSMAIDEMVRANSDDGVDADGGRDKDLVGAPQSAPQVADVLASLLQAPPLEAWASGSRAAAQCVMEPPPTLLVIDGAGQLFGPSLVVGQYKQYIGHAGMAETGRCLHAIARRHGTAVLITNTATAVLGSGEHDDDHNNFGTTQRPSLGPSWTFVADATILVEQLRCGELRAAGNAATDGTQHERSATLIKSTRQSTPMQISLPPVMTTDKRKL